ncbi:MAG: 4-(cytidine 5'-diphospho)-2-C-methyl-D-erythritol kinase [Gemmataceae bacterium]
MVIWAPAKVNLYLEVLGKRPDGYHDIATLMVAVSLYDTLTFKEEASGQISLTCDHPSLSVGPDNLVVRAAELLQRRSGCRRGASIHLHKRIPLAAGLAGGSSDAASTLMALNQLWGLEWNKGQLVELAAELGSDMPFFFSTPAAWCTGRGEIVQPLTQPRPLHLVLLCPPVEVSTAAVYGRVRLPRRPLRGEPARRAFTRGDVEAIGRCLHNRLQPAAEEVCPEIARWRHCLQQLQPVGCALSGSGGSLFALCRDETEAQRLAQTLRRHTEQGSRPSVFVVHSCF